MPTGLRKPPRPGLDREARDRRDRTADAQVKNQPMPTTRLPEKRHQIYRSGTVLRSALATIALLPLTSAGFLLLFDRGNRFTVTDVITFPVLIVYYQGWLVGIVVNAVLLVCTFIPVYLVLQWLESAASRRVPESGLAGDGLRRETAPWVVKIVAALDFLLGTVAALVMLDHAIAAATVLACTWATAFGLLKLRAWGWWAAVILHGVVMGIALCGYAVAMVAMVHQFGRPRGHMDLISPTSAAVVLSLVFVLIELIAAVPLILLCRNATRRVFFCREA